MAASAVITIDDDDDDDDDDDGGVEGAGEEGQGRRQRRQRRAEGGRERPTADGRSVRERGEGLSKSYRKGPYPPTHSLFVSPRPCPSPGHSTRAHTTQTFSRTSGPPSGRRGGVRAGWPRETHPPPLTLASSSTAGKGSLPTSGPSRLQHVTSACLPA